MNRVFLVIVGVVATLMLKQSFYIAPTITQKNIWIIVGIVIMLFLGVRNFMLTEKQTRLKSKRNEALHKNLTVGVDLKLELILRTILKNEGKIEAIKRLREETQMDLKAAAEFINNLETT